MDRYVSSIKESLSSKDMKYQEVFIHPEEYGNEKINTAIKTGVEDINIIDAKIKDLGNQTHELLEKTVKRLDVVMDIINSEKERLQDIVMLCNVKTDYENAISLNDSDFTGNYNYEEGVFSCPVSNRNSISAKVETVEGNGYVGNKYVRSNNKYQENILSTANAGALLDNNLSTYWEYSRVTASSVEPYLISDFNTDDAEGNCTVTFKLTNPANELQLKSNLNTVKVVGVRYSNDGVKYNDLDILPFTINQKNDTYKDQGYIYGSNIIAFPKSKYIKVTFQSTGYLNEVLAFERTVAQEDTDNVQTYTTIVPSAKRHVIRINDAYFKEKIYSGKASLKSRELIDSSLNIFAISVFANIYLPEGVTEDSVKFTLTVNGNDYVVNPVNSHTNGIKIVRFSQGKIPNKYTQYIGEKIQSAYLTVSIRPQQGLTPYVSNLKILLGDEI